MMARYSERLDTQHMLLNSYDSATARFVYIFGEEQGVEQLLGMYGIVYRMLRRYARHPQALASSSKLACPLTDPGVSRACRA
jgi:hypothetical protein